MFVGAMVAMAWYIAAAEAHDKRGRDLEGTEKGEMKTDPFANSKNCKVGGVQSP